MHGLHAGSPQYHAVNGYVTILYATQIPFDIKLGSRGKSLVCLEYKISRFSRGFLPKAYEISDF